jgi:hypothetical protein
MGIQEGKNRGGGAEGNLPDFSPLQIHIESIIQKYYCDLHIL